MSETIFRSTGARTGGLPRARTSRPPASVGVAAVAGRAWAIVTSVDGGARRPPANDLDRLAAALAAAEGRLVEAGLLTEPVPTAVQ